MNELKLKQKAGGVLYTATVAILALALAALTAIVLRNQFVKPPRPPDEALWAIRNDPVTYIGEKTAPTKVELYAPLMLEWHQKTIGLLRDYDKQHPGKIYVTLMPMGNTDCDAVMSKRGFTCAVVFINGQHEFLLPNGRKVDLQKRPNNGDASTYNSEDVIAVLEGLKPAGP